MTQEKVPIQEKYRIKISYNFEKPGTVIYLDYCTFAMATALPCMKVAIWSCKFMRKMLDYHLPIILIVWSGIRARCRVRAPLDCREWDLILYAQKPNFWKPSFRVSTCRVSVTWQLVMQAGTESDVDQQVHIGSDGSALLLQRWMNWRADVVTTSPCGIPVTIIDMDSTQMLLFYVFTKRVVTHALRKASFGISLGITPSSS